MKTVLLYRHPQKGFRAVKAGFSWPGFFFMLIWAFVKRLYGFGLLVFGIWLAVEALYMMTILEAMDYTDSVFIVLLLCYAIVMGFSGNKFLSKSLMKKGYKHVRTLQTESVRVAVEEAVIATQASS